MEISANHEETIMENVGEVEIRSPEGRNIRRRLIQSTLFPHKLPDMEKGVEEELEGEDCDEGDDEDEEYRGSQSKKPRKRKITPVSKKVKVKEGSNGRGKKRDSPATVKSNFFVKVSDRRVQKKQERELQCDDSPEGIIKICSPSESMANLKSPQKSKEKRQINSTPKKKLAGGNLKVPCGSESTSPILTEKASQPVPDLRLEAKMTAEENSRLFAGKQVHPFFSLKKSSKKHQETIEVDNYSCSVERKNKNVTLGPIHVFETLQHDDFPFDWTKWTFLEKTSSASSCAPNRVFSSIFEGSVESLNIDKLLGVSPVPTASCLGVKAFSEQCPDETQYSQAQAGYATLCDDQVGCLRLTNETKMDSEADKFGIFPGHAGNLESLDDDRDDRFSQERLMANYIGSSNLTRDSLWTEKYQPEKSIEVCGNSDSVKFLSEWLHLWHEKDFRGSKDSANDDNNSNINSDDDRDYYRSDCDSDYSDEEDTLKNVLLVTGPVGSGKSAAIYACAKEQGFKVIEVNTSDWRNGALVKQKFREAVESHRLKWSLQSNVGSQEKCIIDCDPTLPNNDEAQDFDSEIIESIPLSGEEECHDAIKTTYGSDDRAACGRDGTKSLVLFEDVDITFLEDRGLIAAIQQLAETAKLPMILTTNSNGPVLPESFDRLELNFTIPTPAELLSRVHMVCATEKTSINPYMRERFVKYFHGDIRKTIMHLQFWCQGKRDTKDCMLPRTYGPLQFDIMAGHSILPKIFPWDFPSQLSELVENEISESLSNIQGNFSSINVVGEEHVNEEMQDRLHTLKNERECIDAKKEALLSRNCLYYDYNEYQAPTENLADSPEAPDSSGSPVAFTRRNTRKKLDKVLSFSSEDEAYGGRLHDISVKETNDEVIPNLNCSIPLPPVDDTLGCRLHAISLKDGNNEVIPDLNCSTPFPQADDTYGGRLHDIDVKETNNEVVPNLNCINPFPPADDAYGGRLHDTYVKETNNEVVPNLNCSIPLPPADDTYGGKLRNISIKETNNEVIPDLNCSIPFPPVDDTCLNPIVAQLLHCDSPQISPATQNGLNASTDELLSSDKIQDSRHQCSNVAAESYVSYTCGSLDISCVPESSFVPETEMNDGTELLSRDFSFCHPPDNGEATSMDMESMLNISPILDENQKPLSRLRKRSETMLNGFANVESSQGEGMGDCQYVRVESVTRRYQVMDECSRTDFNKKIESCKKPGPNVVTRSVQETWDKLRGCRADFRQLVNLEETHASEIVKRAFEFSSLISDADLLLSNFNLLTSDSADPLMIPSKESDSFGWYNEQLQMTSTIAEHGFVLYTNDIAATESSISSNCRVDLVSEMLASTNDTMALGKLTRQEMKASTLPNIGTSEMRQSQPGNSQKWKMESCFRDIIHSIVPLKSRFSLKGDVYNEYLSSLGKISRSEASRLSPGSTITRRRRGRAARHYLSNGLSPEDISLLNQHNCYGKLQL